MLLLIFLFMYIYEAFLYKTRTGTSNLSADVKLSFCQNQLIIDGHLYQADKTGKQGMWR